MSIFSEIPDYDNGTVTHSYEEQLKTMHGIIGGLKIEIRDLERKIQTSTSSVIITNIEILGIFIAVVFVLFGIFNLTVEAFSFVNISISRMLFIISCLTFIMFNSVFLLLYAISRFIDKSIAMNCSRVNSADVPCQKCKKRKRWKWMCKLKNKFTYVLIVNAACFFALIASAIIHYFRI